MPTFPLTIPAIAQGAGISALIHLGAIAAVAAWPRELVRHPGATEAPAVVDVVPVTDMRPPEIAAARAPDRPPRPALAARRTRLLASATLAPAPAPVRAQANDALAPAPAPPLRPERDPMPLQMGASTPSALPPMRPVRISPELARELRIYDIFPGRPGPMRFAGSSQTVLLEVCITEHGTVNQVSFARGSSESLASLLRDSIQTWRYRALVLRGQATPFCHDLKIVYRSS